MNPPTAQADRSPAQASDPSGAFAGTVFADIVVDVFDRRGTDRRIVVRVGASAPAVADPLPVVARFRLAGQLLMVGGDFPRAPGETAEYLGLEGRTYRALRPRSPSPSATAGRDGAEPIVLSADEIRMLGVRDISRLDHAATGRPFNLWRPNEVEPWCRELADRYDLTWATPVVAGFEAAVAGRLLVAGGDLLEVAPFPMWWSNQDTNEISLDAVRFAVNYLRNADRFSWSGLDAARRYLGALNFRRGEPQILGGVEFMDPAYGHTDDLRSLCSVIAPWIAHRWARHLADVPADLVRHCHDAANWTGEAYPERTDLMRLASALAELLAKSGPLPDVRRGEWPQQAVDALLVRLHAVEGVPQYGDAPSLEAPNGPAP
ncbi:hypothetical protein [Methylobacterium sp. 092160098-2]|uniref:hypothetical protein n=1 Tax=Methylobacterium sp. 092160098-2 TaxID=3025129 RepID=UPI00238198B2|nr:hypothetical protein [Methylobacterium sp. 092160098-2]MDE4914771.1 hypothetical protein [Methylobacterium sp. 092160098-2]